MCQTYNHLLRHKYYKLYYIIGKCKCMYRKPTLTFLNSNKYSFNLILE